MGPVNILAKFEARSFTCSWDNRRYWKNMLIAPKYIKIRTSNLAWMLPGKARHDPWKNFRTKGVVTVTWACKLYALNANISKTAKDTNFKFGRHAPWNVPTEFLKHYFRKGAWSSSRDLVNCMALSANSYKMVEAIPYMDFKIVSVPIKHV